ncbi:MAG: DUF3108 domain-containing protein [Acidobacteria bacterium]|nr:DUF3108 domain-containing protein [Acidobacteriota bacterium]
MRLLVAVALSAAAWGQAPKPVALTYNAEWRLIHAGTVNLNWEPAAPTAGHAKLHIESTGLISRLYKINNDYHANLAGGFCAIETGMEVREGNRQRSNRVTYDHEKKQASFVERDLIKNTVISSHTVSTPACVHDVLGALMAMRRMNLAVGQSGTLPVSDGKKFAEVRVEAQEREIVKTPLGVFKAVRYEAHLLNNVIYPRSGRVYFWLTDDDRKLPVQVRVRLQILIGTITLQLVKEENP